MADNKSVIPGSKTPANAAAAQPHGVMAARDSFLEMQALIKSPRPVIIDGGAFTGETSLKFLALFPKAAIFAFEANPEIADELKRQMAPHPGVKIFPNAIGAEGRTIQFNVTNFPGASSVLQPHQTVLKYHGEKLHIKATKEVAMVRIDSVVTEPEIDILKLDLQGFELDALKGAEKLLNNTKLIYTEIEFTELYNDQPLFSHIDLYLRQRGFRLLNYYNLWSHPDGQLTSGDAIYLNSKYF